MQSGDPKKEGESLLEPALRTGTAAGAVGPSRYKVCAVSIVASFGLFLLKNRLSALSGSVSLRADSLHSLSDMLTTVLLVVGFALTDLARRTGRISERTARSAEFAMQASALGLIVFYGITLYRSMQATPVLITNHAFALGGAFVAIVLTNILYRYKARAAEALDSPALRADALETRFDQLTSGIVFASVLLAMMGLSFESTAAVIILLFVLYHGIEQGVSGLVKLFTGHDLSFGTVLRALVRSLRGWKRLPRMPRLPTSRLSSGQVRRTTGIALATAVVTWCLSGIYTLKPGQFALVQRFGLYRPDLGSMAGLNYRLPWPVDEVKILDVERVLNLEMPAQEAFKKEYLITKDENLIDAAVALQYRLTDPAAYVFAAAEPERLVRDVMVAAVTAEIGREDIDRSLLDDKQRILDNVRDAIQLELARLGIGITVVGLQFKVNGPPDEVKEAFTEVSSAREDMRTKVDSAYAKANETLPAARGQAEKLLREAEAYREDVMQRALGDAARLGSLRIEHARAPAMTRAKLYHDTVEQVLAKARLYVVATDHGKGPRLRLLRGTPVGPAVTSTLSAGGKAP